MASRCATYCARRMSFMPHVMSLIVPDRVCVSVCVQTEPLVSALLADLAAGQACLVEPL